MPLRKFESGSMFNVYVFEEVGSDGVIRPSSVATWMRELDPRHKKTLGLLIKRHASHGRIRDEAKSRELGDGIFEFKSHHGAGERLAYFHLGHGRTVLSHGFQKGANVQAQIRRAQAVRARVLEEEAL